MGTRKLVPPRKCGVEVWLQYQYFNRFGSDEFKEKFEDNDIAWCRDWWRKEIAESVDGVLPLEEYKSWFYLLHKKRPKRFEYSTFVSQMMLQGMYLAPRTIEEAEDIKQKLRCQRDEETCQATTTNDSQGSQQ